MIDELFEQRIDLTGLSKAMLDLQSEIQKVIVGQDEMVKLILAALLADGHVLIEGVPGVAKTLTARLMAKSLEAGFSRIQFTPDLMPSDVLGTSIFNPGTSSFEFKRGAYIHRRFFFSNGVLTSKNIVPPEASLSSQCLIDRIILLGHTLGPKSALVEPLNQKAEIEMGPLRMGGLVASSGTNVLTIRKPGVRVDQDWTIKIL